MITHKTQPAYKVPWLKLIVINLIGLLIIALVFVCYWFLPVRRYTYTVNGQKIFSIGYPLRFSGKIVANGDYLDLGTSKNSDSGVLIHFIYLSPDSLFGEPEISPEAVTSCNDLAAHDLDKEDPSYVTGYTSQVVDGRTLCFMNNDQVLEPDNDLGTLILNPAPKGVLSVLYSDADSFEAKMLVRSIQVYK